MTSRVLLLEEVPCDIGQDLCIRSKVGKGVYGHPFPDIEPPTSEGETGERFVMGHSGYIMPCLPSNRVRGKRAALHNCHASSPKPLPWSSRYRESLIGLRGESGEWLVSRGNATT